jgi:ADP-heptose:LPS heptosyltransferase
MWMRLIGRSLPGPRVTILPLPLPNGARVLFIRYERIGDMIMATSVIRAIAESLPGKKVDVLATPTTAPVLENNPHVGRVLTLNRGSLRSYLGLMRRLRGAGYKVMVDGRINNPPIFTSTPLMMLAGGATYRIGSGGGRNPDIYNVCVPEYDRSTHYIDGSKSLAMPFGVDPAGVNWQPEIFLTEDERDRAGESWRAAIQLAAADGQLGSRKRLLVNLSASEPKRRWPDDKFIATLRDARKHSPGMAIVVMGLPSEWESVQHVAGAVGALPVQTPKLRDAFALVGTADLVFTPDTSISHAASAFKRPSLVLLKWEHQPYAPYDTPGAIVAWKESEIRLLPYERVSAALLGLIREFG